MLWTQNTKLKDVIGTEENTIVNLIINAHKYSSINTYTINGDLYESDLHVLYKSALKLTAKHTQYPIRV